MSNPINICIVDDDSIYQYTIVKTIKTLGLETKLTSFIDGEEALSFMLNNLNDKKELPDIILLDINMPIMDGFQFMDEFEKIKPKLGKKIVVYMVSSSVDPKDIERTKTIRSISDYIIKPIEIGKLKAIIENL